MVWQPPAAVWQAVAPAGWGFSRAFLPNKAQYFALGIAAAALQRDPNRESLVSYIGVLSITLAACSAGGVAKLVAPLVWTACLAAQMRPDTPGLGALAWALRTPVLLWLGAISYCLYLVNEPVQKLLGVIVAALAGGDATRFTLFWLPASILLPIGFAWVLHLTVERAGQHWGRTISLRLHAAIPIGG